MAENQRPHSNHQGAKICRSSSCWVTRSWCRTLWFYRRYIITNQKRKNNSFHIFSLLGNEINIGNELIREGYALEEISEAIGTDQVLRLSSGSDANAGPTTPPMSNIVQLTNIINKNNGSSNTSSTQQNKTNADKFTAICENTSNENFENTKIDQSQLIGQFIANEAQQQNGLNANTSSDNSSVMKNGHFDGNLNDLTTSRPGQTA